jgi:hypothetical protein
VTKDEIQLALRHVAIGRVNTEAVMAFIDRLEALMAEKPVEVMVDADGFVDVGGGLEVAAEKLLAAEPGSIVPATPKRGRKAKAD